MSEVSSCLDRMQPPLRFLLCRCCNVSAASCFFVLTLKPLGWAQMNLEWWWWNFEVQPVKSCRDSRPASCGVLAALLGLAKRSEVLRLSLPDCLLSSHYSEPQNWKHWEQSVAVCFGIYFASSGPIMQQLIGLVLCKDKITTWCLVNFRTKVFFVCLFYAATKVN